MQRQSLIEQRIKATFSVSHLELLNESHNHRGGENAQTHFKCVLVSPDFVVNVPYSVIKWSMP
mgnify:CR=1 FL=1